MSPRRTAKLDALIDAIAPLTLESPVTGELALIHLPPSRRAGTKPFLIEGLNAESGEWELPASGQRYSEFQAGVQLRTPLVIGGTLGSPTAGVEAAPLVARGLAALALGAINPLLALAATVETGPGENADCQEILKEARTPQSSAAKAGAAKGKTAGQ